MRNIVAKVSTELIKGDQADLLKSKLFVRLTRRLGEIPFYG